MSVKHDDLVLGYHRAVSGGQVVRLPGGAGVHDQFVAGAIHSRGWEGVDDVSVGNSGHANVGECAVLADDASLVVPHVSRVVIRGAVRGGHADFTTGVLDPCSLAVVNPVVCPCCQLSLITLEVVREDESMGFNNAR